MELQPETQNRMAQAMEKEQNRKVAIIRDDENPQKRIDSQEFANVGRNDPCPCGSGKKFKHCHGRIVG